MGHKKADCLTKRGGVVSAPAPAILRITDEREGKAGALVERIQALQCQTREARTPTVDVASMYPYFLFSLICILLLESCISLG